MRTSSFPQDTSDQLLQTFESFRQPLDPAIIEDYFHFSVNDLTLKCNPYSTQLMTRHMVALDRLDRVKWIKP
jgi:hypothetical protein